MASASGRPKRVSKEIDAETLDAFLKDVLFVDYFNAFLSLPTFSFKVKYDPDCGEFVELCSAPSSPSHTGQSAVSLISSEVSLLSLSNAKQYTTKPLDPARGLSWVLKDRLPLFLRSDLYSEYQLCRLMDRTSALGEESLVGRTQSLTVNSTSGQCSAERVCERIEDGCSMEHEVRGGGPADLEGSPPHKQILSLKEAHNFRHFLQEKAGERNWMFWIEAERMKHLKREEEKAKWMKQLRHKYIRSGSQHQLPSEVLVELGVTKSSRFTADKLAAIQGAMAEALRSYWYPSFLLHVACEERRRLKREKAEPQLSEMRYMGPQPALSRAVSADRLSRAVSLRYRSSSSTGGSGHAPQGGRPRSFSASEVTLRVEDFLSKSKMGGKKKGAGPRLGQLKECRWMDEAKTNSTPSGNGSGKSTRQETGVGGAHWVQSAPVKDRGSRRPPAKQDPPETDSLPAASPQPKLPCVPGHASPSHSSTAQGEPPRGEDYRRLLKCLALEQWKAGGCFQHFLEQQGADAELCLHCLAFWREVQLFKKHFYSPIFTPAAVETRAKELHSTFIVEGASFSIQCPPEVRRVVQRSLWPAFEELFDAAEEHALSVLVGRWRKMVEEEESKVASKVLQKGRRASKAPQPSGDKAGEGVPLGSSSSIHVTEGGARGNHGNREEAPDKPWTLLDVLTSPTEREYFKVFLNKNMAALDLMCWTEIESFRALPANDTVLRNAKARQIKSKFLCKKYFFGAGSPASKEQQKQVIACQGGGYMYHLPARPGSPVFREAQKYVRARLEKKWVPLFIAQPDFLARTSGGSRKERGFYTDSISPSNTVTLETEIALHSHDAILLRKSLRDTDVRQQFSTYLSIVQGEGEHLANNVLFWVEVQRFKTMYHNHTTMGVLGRKMRAILSSFLLSATPPKVQVSVSPEVADQTILKMDKMGPYIFREAQTAVFRSLLTYWVDFTDFAGDTPYHLICFDELREKKAKQEEAARRRAEAQQAEVERQLSMQPRFETPEEKLNRLAKRKEEREMGGRIAISFSLCEPTEKTFQTAQTQTVSSTPIPMEEYSRGTSPLKQNGRRLSAPPLNHIPSHSSSRQLADSSRPISTMSTIVSQSEVPKSPEVPTRGGSPSKPRSQSQSQMGMGTADSPLFMTQLQWCSPKRRSSVPLQCGSQTKKTLRRGSKTGLKQTELTLLVEPAVSRGGELEVRTSDDGRSKVMNWRLSSPNQKVLFGTGIQTSSVLLCTEETVQ